MKVGLAQVDGKLPNLALMQICAYHESLGHHVEWFKGELYADEYDEIYASKIFKFSVLPQLPSRTILGGTGVFDFENAKRGEQPKPLIDPELYDLRILLPDEMATLQPSYLIYPDCSYHVGFSMKGCRFNCAFCGVPKKEGRPRVNSSIDGLLINPVGGDRLMLLDNDFFGGADWKVNLLRIIELNLKVCFVQGLNIRILTDEQAELLASCKYYTSKFNMRRLTFAWDRFQDRQLIINGIDRCKKYGIKPENMQFFVLIGFDTTPEQDLYRVSFLKEQGCYPFVMPYNKFDPYQKRFARWVNHKAVFRNVPFDRYDVSAKNNRLQVPQEQLF